MSEKRDFSKEIDLAIERYKRDDRDYEEYFEREYQRFKIYIFINSLKLSILNEIKLNLDKDTNESNDKCGCKISIPSDINIHLLKRAMSDSFYKHILWNKKG